MSSRYSTMVSTIQGGQPMQVNIVSAVSAYLLMVAGLHAFVIQPDADETIQSSLVRGFAFGVVVYGVYDFTAGAVFEKWDWPTAFMDVVWGGSVFAVASGVAHHAMRSLGSHTK